MYGTCRSTVMRWTASARRRAWLSDSITQGPAIRKRSSPPMGTLPSWKGWGMVVVCGLVSVKRNARHVAGRVSFSGFVFLTD
jgi:hypothetical protein